VADVEFGHGPVDVGLGGRGADHHAGGDLVVGQSSGDQGDGLAFAGGQFFQVRSGRGEGLGDVPVDQAPGDRGGQERVAACGDADGVEEVLRPDVLDEETGGPGAQCFQDVLVHAVVGQDDDVESRQGRVRGDAACGLDGGEDGQLDVDERDVGEVLAGQREGLPSVGGLGHDLDVVLQVDERPESAADERLVVDQQDPDHDVPPTGSSAWTEKPPSG